MTQVSTLYRPRPLQLSLHQNVRRFNVLVMHRRFGKTVWALNHMIDRALRHTMPMPRFAYVAPTYGQAKRIAWDYLKLYSSMIPGIEPNEADLRIDIPQNQARIQLLSAENAMTNKGIYLDGLILDEFAEMLPGVWGEVFRPMLSDRRGWATFVGTPKGQNHFYERLEYARNSGDPDWYHAVYKASETGIITQAELDSAKREMTEEEYLQEFECSFTAALVGAYFGKELDKARAEGRITRVPHDPSIPVDLYLDLGVNDAAAAWFMQSLRGRHRAIDYLEMTGASIPEFVAAIRAKDPTYNFGEWVFPHDAEARDFSTGRTQLQIFRQLGCRRHRVIPRVGTKRESINAARMIFPVTEFDEVKCRQGIRALENYQRKWDPKGNVFAENPLHNWASNGADAFQQFGLGAREDSRRESGTRYDRDGSPMVDVDRSYSPYGRRVS